MVLLALSAFTGCVTTREFDFVVHDPRRVTVVDAASTHPLSQPNVPAVLADGNSVERGASGEIVINVRGEAPFDALLGRSFRMILVRSDGVVNADGPLGAVKIVDGTVSVPACYGTGKHPCAQRVTLRTPECNVSVLREREVPLRALGAVWMLAGAASATAFALQMDLHQPYLAPNVAVLSLFGAFAVIGFVNLVAPSGSWANAMQRTEQCPDSDSAISLAR